MGNCCSFSSSLCNGQQRTRSRRRTTPPLPPASSSSHPPRLPPPLVKKISVELGKTRSGSVASVRSSDFSSEARDVVRVSTFPKNVKELKQNAGQDNVHIFKYDELKWATNVFRPDQILGEGGFGIVYKGVIDERIRPGFKSTVVAVKELDREGFQGDREWLAEVNYLGQLSHPNLVRLIGYCCEGDHRLIVYDYMPHGSLERHLFRSIKTAGGSVTMPWPIRMKIALGAAKGLAFLHEAERPIIYRDFKTSNILLDEDFNAKLSDFGLAKEGPVGDKTHVSTRVMGTYGYAAPEYIATGHLTAMSDVYAFGVVLLEMLIGRRAMDKNKPSQEHNLVDWSRPLLIRTSKLMRIIDPRMQGQYSNKDVQKVANLAYQCLSHNPKGRPTMRVVVDNLQPFQEVPAGAVMQYAAASSEVLEGSSTVRRVREADCE